MNTKKGKIIREHLENITYELSLGCTCQEISYFKKNADYCITCSETKQ